MPANGTNTNIYLQNDCQDCRNERPMTNSEVHSYCDQKTSLLEGFKKNKKTNPTIFQFNEIEKLVKKHRPPHSPVRMLLQKLIFCNTTQNWTKQRHTKQKSLTNGIDLSFTVLPRGFRKFQGTLQGIKLRQNSVAQIKSPQKEKIIDQPVFTPQRRKVAFTHPPIL